MLRGGFIPVGSEEPPQVSKQDRHQREIRGSRVSVGLNRISCTSLRLPQTPSAAGLMGSSARLWRS